MRWSVIGRWPLAKNKKLAAVAAVALLLVLTMGAGDDATRFNSLGHRMICACGCNQILLECNHVGCTYSDRMRNELSTALTRGDSDDLVLQGFVQKYGATVLSAPTTTGFNRVAWIMPFAVLAAGTWLAVMFARRWQGRVVTRGAGADLGEIDIAGMDVEALRRRAREETQL
ncbi:MAG TPA: cytochrome c-type biogenesis protein CcmH [Terriglobales bacterium]|nr:cytochrome c-type biogenesis protein CcmH [Terriglobales bacterium]